MNIYQSVHDVQQIQIGPVQEIPIGGFSRRIKIRGKKDNAFDTEMVEITFFADSKENLKIKETK